MHAGVLRDHAEKRMQKKTAKYEKYINTLQLIDGRDKIEREKSQSRFGR